MKSSFNGFILFSSFVFGVSKYAVIYMFCFISLCLDFNLLKENFLKNYYENIYLDFSNWKLYKWLSIC